MNRSLYSMESRFLFLDRAMKRMYEMETMCALYALIAEAENRDDATRMIAELMEETSDDQTLLLRAQRLLGKAERQDEGSPF